MERTDIDELHYITHVDNIPSIMERGILSRHRVGRLQVVHPVSVADPEVLRRRAERWIPKGLRLNRYVNLFFNARNAMLFKLIRNPDAANRVNPENLAILRVHSSILDLPDVVITEINAAADVAPRWYKVEEGLARLDEEEIFTEWWTGNRELMQRMMAEVLVPNLVPTGYLAGAYVVSEEAGRSLSQCTELPVTVRPYLYFRGPKDD